MRFVSAVTLVLLLALGAADAQDIPGSQDHPVITRYPGSAILWYSIENYRPYRVPTGPVTGYRQVEEGIDTEGRVTRIYYALDGGERGYDEVYRNYRDALVAGGFEVLAEGLVSDGARGTGVGSRQWREVLFLSNPWNDSSGAVNEMARGSSTSGGGGAVVARMERADSSIYVVAAVYQFRDDRVSTLVDVIEVAQAETGLIVADAEAIGNGIVENGRAVLDGILFDFDKATLRAESAQALEQIAAFLKAEPGKRFYVVGHTDTEGTFAYNRQLSFDRARAVVDALVKRHGIENERLEPHGVGSLVPVFSNSSDAGRERNRRVELVER